MDIIELLKYIFLGMIQGFTEPLPISSSGHLVIFQELFGISINDLNFEIIVNAGSLVAILIIYFNDLKKLVINFFKYIFKRNEEYKDDFIYCLLIVLAVIPAGIIGYFFKDFIDSVLKNIVVVGISLIITSIALNLINKEATENTEEKIKPLDALIIGLFQIFALIPGISRSGSTMVGGLKRKLKFESVMKFSFLLYIPISLASLLLAVLDLSQTQNPFIIGYIVAFLVSIVTTYIAVKLLFKVVRQGNLKYFSVYCMSVGIIVLVVNFILGVI